MEKISNTITVLIVAVSLWTAITCFIQAFENPSLTQTQLFENIPNSFVLDFK